MHHLQHALIVRLLAQFAQQRHLQAAQRVQIGNAQRKAAGEWSVVGKQGFGLQNIQQRFQAALVFGFDGGETIRAVFIVLAERGVVFGERSIGFRHHLFHVRQHGAEETVLLGVLLQGVEAA